VPVEPAAQAVERMKSPAFQMKVAKQVGVQEWGDDLARSAGATTKYITLQIVKATATPGPGGAPLIELRANGGSAEVARKIAEASISELAKRQLELAKPSVDKMQLDLRFAKENLSSVEREIQNIHKLVTSVVIKDNSFSHLSLMTALRTNKELELFKLRQVINSLEAALTVPYTQPAEALEDVFVTDRPVSPKKSLLLAVGLIGGLLAGIVAVFFIDAWRRAKELR
jgi:capsular polysaccharide biosynthesis protein